jgi:hypothetical protein
MKDFNLVIIDLIEGTGYGFVFDYMSEINFCEFFKFSLD